jgi:hypothetical protein
MKSNFTKRRKDSVMSQDLSLSGRSYKNPFLPQNEEDENYATVDPDHTVRLERIGVLMESYTSKLMDAIENEKEARFRQDESVYVGGAGVAFTCLKSAAACNEERQRTEWLNLAHRFSEIDPAEEKLAGRHNCSLMCGLAGRVLVDLMVRHARDEEVDVTRYFAFADTAVDSKCDEILYGRAGYLLGLLQLKQIGCDVPENIIMKVANRIIEKGKEGGKSFDGAPWMWEWHEKKYLGAAHGVMGILYVLMHVPQVVAKHRSDIKLMIDWLAARREKDYDYNWPSSVRHFSNI